MAKVNWADVDKRIKELTAEQSRRVIAALIGAIMDIKPTTTTDEAARAWLQQVIDGAIGG